MPLPQVSVVVPFHNQAPYLEACLRALFSQRLSGASFEAILVDNNSTDESCGIVRRFPQATLLHESKQGAYAARNLGTRHARGEYLVFLDADCVAGPGWLDAIYGALRAPGVALAMGPVMPATAEGPLRWLGDFGYARDVQVYSSPDPSVYYAHGGNMAVSRAAFERFGPFEERRRGSDAALAQKIVHALTPDAAVFVPQAVVRHLEIESVAGFCGKMYAYGRTREMWSSSLQLRALSFGEKWAAYTQTHAPIHARAGLLVCLAMGSISWWAGTMSGRLGNSTPRQMP